MEGIYDAKHVARVAVTPALRPRDHPEAGSTLGKDPGQPAQPAARFSKGPENSPFLSFCVEGSLGLSDSERKGCLICGSWNWSCLWAMIYGCEDTDRDICT